MTKRLSNIEAEHLACELTYINKILLLKVRIDDIQSINSQCISEMYANNSLVIWMTFSEQMRNMVVAEVVTQKDMLDRLQAMRYFMKVAIVCWKIQNFNTTANILCAFHSPAIYNVKKAWDWFKMKYPFTYHSFQKLSSVFFEDNCRSYRNAFRKAIDNPPYIPWISHFLNHTVIPTWKTYIHGWKKNRIRNLLNEKLQTLECKSYIANANLYISGLTTKTRSYREWRNMSDPMIKRSIKDPETSEENKPVNTTAHKVSYKECFPEVNKYHINIKDVDIQNRGGSYENTPQKLYKAKLNLDDLTKKKAYRLRTHYQVQSYELKSSEEKSGKSTSTKSKTDSSPMASTSDNSPKSTSTSNNANGEETTSIASSITLPTENIINELSVPNNKRKTNRVGKHNEAIQEVNENISAPLVASQNTKDGQITGGRRLLSTPNSDCSDYREVIQISQEYVKANGSQNIYEPLPQFSFSQSNVLSENVNNFVPTMRQRSETCFQFVYPLSMNQNKSEPEYFQGVSVSSSIEKLSRTFSDFSREKLSFENLSKEVSIFQRIPDETNSLKHKHEEAGILEHDFEESHAVEQVSKEIGVFHTISEPASILKNIPGEDRDLQAISGEAKPFYNVSDEESIAEKFQEVSCAFKNLRDEIIALEKLPDETNVFENILNETDAFDKIHDVAGAFEIFVKEVGCFEMLLHKEDAFEKIREIADVVKTILEEVSGYKNAYKQVTDNVSDTLRQMDPYDHLSQNIVFEGNFKELNPHGEIKRILRLKISEKYIILCNMDTNGCRTEQIISLSASELRVLDKTRKRIALNLANENSMIFELGGSDAMSKKNWENIILLINKLSNGGQSRNIGKRVLIAENIDSFEKASKHLLDICNINESIVFEYYFVELNLKGQGMRQVYMVITNKQVYFASQSLHYLTLKEKIPLGNIDMFVMNYLYKRIGIYLTGSVRIFEMCNNWENNKTHNIWLELVKLINYKEKENKTNISGGGIIKDLDSSNVIENFPKRYSYPEDVDLASLISRSMKKIDSGDDPDSEDSIRYSICKQKYPRKEDCYLPNYTDIKAEQLAFELTYVTKTLILRIRAEDLIHFQKRNLRLKHSNNSVAVLMTFCDQVISMVITELINQTNLQDRLRTMKYFLQGKKTKNTKKMKVTQSIPSSKKQGLWDYEEDEFYNFNQNSNSHAQEHAKYFDDDRKLRWSYIDFWNCPFCGNDICIYADLPTNILLRFQSAVAKYPFQSQFILGEFLKSYRFLDTETLFRISRYE
ncbi:XP_036362857.1uncharacterized protein LOC118765226 [Octopus vulgaris]|uniref:XP_036362857.1uncharacterized protein LOC118765226 n=1 Tax=Octopus vulgaris TaxID=6645 RepID=A0AA36B5N2_OCTVU|nr:XP_036362857.1uncharacterized protein LOC118765226 [Octopus vulgaris]